MRSTPQASFPQRRPQPLSEPYKQRGWPWETWSIMRSTRLSVWSPWLIRCCWPWILKGDHSPHCEVALMIAATITDVSLYCDVVLWQCLFMYRLNGILGYAI